MAYKQRNRKELQQLAERAAKYCRLPVDMTFYVSIRRPAPKWAKADHAIRGIVDIDDRPRRGTRIGRIWIDTKVNKADDVDPAATVFHEVAHLVNWVRILHDLDEQLANERERDLYALYEQGVF